MYIIGSRALAHHISLQREPADLDVVCTYDDAVKLRRDLRMPIFYPIAEGRKIVMKSPTQIVEADIAWPGSVEEKLLNFLDSQPDSYTDADGFTIPSLDVLYLLKMSHRYKKNSVHFKKTMDDILVMRMYDAKIRPDHEEFYKDRMKDTYNYGHPKLNVNKKTFFTDTVPYTYDHDSIHVAIAIGDQPAYRYYMKEEAEVMTDKAKFFSVDERTRILGVIEESMVLAIERSLVPFPGMKTPEEAFKMALEKVCTSITSGWFREYAWENYYEALHQEWSLRQSGHRYWDVFQEQVKQGKVKLHQKETA